MEHFEIYDVKRKPCECAARFGTKFDKIISVTAECLKELQMGHTKSTLQI